MIDRRTLLDGTLGLLGAGALTGCAGQGRAAKAGHKSVPDSWFKVRVRGLLAIDPMTVCDRAGLQVMRFLYTPLLTHVDGALIGAAARSFEVSDDARTFTFSLREGATFHNGEEVTASSFKRAWERLVAGPARYDEEASENERTSKDAPADGSLLQSPWAPLLSLVEGYDALSEGRASEMVGLRCPDDLTLEVALTQPYAGFADIVAHPVLGPAPISSTRENSSYASWPIGNGPFKLKGAWDEDEDIWLVRFADAVTPALADGALVCPNADTASAYNQFLAGALDICEVPVDQVRDAQESVGESETPGAFMPGARCTAPLGSRITYLACNTAVGAMSHPELRRAACAAIDRDTLVRKVLGGAGEAAASLVGPAIAEVPAWEACQFDAEMAQQLLEDLMAAHEADAAAIDAGSSGETLVEEASEPLDLTVRLVYRKGGMNAKLASQMAADLKAVGFTVKAEGLSEGDYRARLAEGAYECALATFEPTVPSLEAAVAPLVGGLPSCGVSAAAGATATVEELLVAACRERDRAVREDLVRQVLTHESEELALLPVVFTMSHVVASNRISAAHLDALGVLDPVSVSVL